MMRTFFSLVGKRDIYRVLISHTLRAIAFSVVGVYIPIYLLTRGYSLAEVIGYYAVLHGFGLVLALTVIPQLIERLGLIRTLKANYLFQTAELLLLFLLPFFPVPIWIIALFAGAATFFYWVPLNILIIKNADFDKMGTDLASFFALPKLFGILGPLIGAGLVYFVGFWPTFLIALIGVCLSFAPIAQLDDSKVQVRFRLREAWQSLCRRKKLFFLESLDNVVEESEWFWGIYVFLIIGSLAVPGIAGSFAAVGAALFTIFIGKKVNQFPKPVMLLSGFALMITSLLQMLVETSFQAYAISLIISFALSAFLVSYTSSIYRQVKGDDEEEFIILREIPTVFGRMLVFLFIILTIHDQRLFFLLPAATIFLLIMVFLTRRELAIRN